uniref:RNA-binding S4 domain-containing protein n=1 Tax=Aegilops tauschii subsp. strangulata TaxID=200361 RepID=A0A453I0J7_AEGTS
MHRGRERTSYIPFLLSQETRSDVIPVRLHFSDTLPQARQPISHRRVCLNNGLVTITHLKVSNGDLISFKEDDARTHGFEIRRSFYIDISVGKIIGKFLSAISVGKRRGKFQPARIWRRKKKNGSAYSQLRGDAAYYSNPRNCKSCVLICKKKTLKEQRSLDPQKYA